MRQALVVGNWKMHKTVAEARGLAAAVLDALAPPALPAGEAGPAVVLAPSFTALAAVAETLRGTALGLAGQTMHWAEAGAFTGEVSPAMLAELAGYVILGHSERRALFGETDEAVQRKTRAALAHGLTPIVCVGETAGERDAGATDRVVLRQLAAALEGLDGDGVARLVIAYEPVWAIGTGRACGSEEAGRVAGLVRAWLAKRHGGPAAAAARLLYGGSVAPANAADLLAAPDVDGALVGGASLDAAGFAAIVAAAARQVPAR